MAETPSTQEQERRSYGDEVASQSRIEELTRKLREDQRQRDIQSRQRASGKSPVSEVPTEVPVEVVKKMMEGAQRVTEDQWNRMRPKNAGDPRNEGAGIKMTGSTGRNTPEDIISREEE